MSRDRSRDRPHLAVVPRSGEQPAPPECENVAEYIGKVALELAGLAQAFGFPTLSYLLERAALEAGAEAASGRPAGTPET